MCTNTPEVKRSLHECAAHPARLSRPPLQVDFKLPDAIVVTIRISPVMTILRSILTLTALVGLMFQAGCSSDRVATELDIASDRIDMGMTNMLGAISSTHRDYDFLLDTGGILVSAPVPEKDGTYFLPIKADVSGASNITRRPIKYHAKIAVREIVVRQGKGHANRLYIYLKTAWPTKEAPSPVTRGVNIGLLEAGRYTIEYLNRDGSTVMLGGFSISDTAAATEESSSGE